MDNTRKEQIKKWKERAYSWSQHSSFNYDPEQWYDKYITHGSCTRELCALGLAICPANAKSPEMEFGSMVGKKLETDPTFLPQIKRQNIMEHEFKCKYGKIDLIGFADSFCTMTDKKLEEYKTGVKKWDQKRVDEHGQLTMYSLMHYLITKTRPEEVEISLWWMPTKRTESGDFSVKIEFIEPIEENIKSFKTKRTMRDILAFGSEINKTYRKMELYALSHS